MLVPWHYNDYDNLSSDVSNYALKSQLTDGSVTKLGTSTYGSNNKPIYWNAGQPAALSYTAGDTVTPIYENSGEFYICKEMIPAQVGYSYYSEVPLTKNTICYVQYSSSDSDSDAPVTSGPCWYNTISIANTSSNRITQISTNVFSNRDRLYFRNKHDSTWYGWYTLLCSNNYSSYAMPIAGSTFTGLAYAQTNTSYSTYQLRNIAFTTSTPSSLTNGYVCMVYS